MNLLAASRRVLACAFLLAASATLPAEPAATREGLRVMSFNIRYAAPQDGANLWAHRRDLWAKTVLARHPDIIGTQELLLSQAADIQQRLPGYAWFGKGRNGNELDKDGNEHMGVFYDTKRLKLIEHGDFWYSETPDVPGSPNFDQSLPRMATWAQFEERSSGKRFYFFDTHFPHRDEAEAVRERCARILLERIARLPKDVPVVVTGDFNSSPDTAAHRLLTTQLHDAWESASERVGPEKTVHAFTGVPTQRIDWILSRGFRTGRVETADDHQGEVFPSDHYPVIADLHW
ncbi:Metal-dependent hydrolase, endonuclease/exonuclease/phosphatase family [Pseudoxanthomonas sp. GM95]|uniref:endonuclease/exonuclease/phosphatase family protein n=1 Tax=Pseudoxanthomonas sp. GM95 TaxID=1881043 RepID=UPI0008C4368F|nr:endonuclease/exonuclease/phosphatase family protein [Pseudoxanthomonas sp. GM95]SEL75128.1 Metal-dependent hydrolase, endonuclease/exonuclease/phosphatase family [Pseudoxanthomonas sp. GM95]